ncbi:MAG: ParB/Srx family N-terminal domain-containing protein, partial [Mycobacterium sp.]
MLMPITAVRDDDGRIMVRDGQRRTLASQKAGLDT